MARGKKTLSLDEQLIKITTEIENMENSLKEMKKAKKEERVAYGKQLCVDYINKLNYVLINHVFHVTIKDNQGNLLYEDNIPGEFKDVNMFVLNKMNNM